MKHGLTCTLVHIINSILNNTSLFHVVKLTWSTTRLPATASAAGFPTLQNKNPEPLYRNSKQYKHHHLHQQQQYRLHSIQPPFSLATKELISISINKLCSGILIWHIDQQQKTDNNKCQLLLNLIPFSFCHPYKFPSLCICVMDFYFLLHCIFYCVCKIVRLPLSH